MTIRCNELNIPAAIGCGKTLFSKLKQAASKSPVPHAVNFPERAKLRMLESFEEC